MVVSQVQFGLIAIVLLLAAAALVHSLWWAIGTGARKRAVGERERLDALFADLWSGEMNRRLASLLVIQRMGAARSSYDLATVLVSFVRHRLADEGRGKDGFEDVRLALRMLAPGRSIAGGRPVDLTGIDFAGVPLFGLDLRQFRLIDCSFNNALGMKTVFRGCDLSGTSFAGADLRGADFTRADLSDANLTGANLTGARLAGARMVSTNIGGAILVNVAGLEQEQLDSAFGDAGTAVPEQFRFVPMKSHRPRVKLTSVSKLD